MRIFHFCWAGWFFLLLTGCDSTANRSEPLPGVAAPRLSPPEASNAANPTKSSRNTIDKRESTPAKLAANAPPGDARNPNLLTDNSTGHFPSDEILIDDRPASEPLAPRSSGDKPIDAPLEVQFANGKFAASLRPEALAAVLSHLQRDRFGNKWVRFDPDEQQDLGSVSRIVDLLFVAGAHQVLLGKKPRIVMAHPGPNDLDTPPAGRELTIQLSAVEGGKLGETRFMGDKIGWNELLVKLSRLTQGTNPGDIVFKIKPDDRLLFTEMKRVCLAIENKRMPGTIMLDNRFANERVLAPSESLELDPELEEVERIPRFRFGSPTSKNQSRKGER